MLIGKEEEGEEERKNKIEIFVFDFLDCEEKSWNFEAVVYVRIAKDFHL